MTREEAINKAINIVSYFEAHFAKSKEARENAANIIEALEQEPTVQDKQAESEKYQKAFEDGYDNGYAQARFDYEQEPCEIEAAKLQQAYNKGFEDCRQAVLEAVKKNTFRLTFSEEQNCEGHVAWSAEAIYSDVIEGALLELPPVTQQYSKKVNCKSTKCENCINHNYCDYEPQEGSEE